MKKFSLLLIISLMFVLVANSQTNNIKTNKDDIKEIQIKTAFHCANGKALIEKQLGKEDGIKAVVADIDTKIVTVKYDATITNKDKIVAAIEKIGYSTEFTPADKKINKACSH